MKSGDVLRTGGAADSNTVLFSLRNDTTRYFKLSKTRRISPECITGFSIQITFEISRGEILQPSVWEDRHLEILAKVRRLNQSSATTEDKRCAT